MMRVSADFKIEIEDENAKLGNQNKSYVDSDPFFTTKSPRKEREEFDGDIVEEEF